MNKVPKELYLDTGYTDLDPVEEAVSQRRSLRGFLPDAVPAETVRRILHLAGRAPSGTNTQPWLAHVLTGDARQRLIDDILAARNAGEKHSAEIKYYPDRFPEPYLSRRRKVGWDLYGLLGITKGDFERTKAQHDRNFTFFDAPVGIIFVIERVMEIGSWLDYGMFLQNVMILARAQGLETCPQVAFTDYHKIIRRHVPMTDDQMVVCGMSLGKAQWDRHEVSLVTEREPTESFVQFHEQ